MLDEEEGEPDLSTVVTSALSWDASLLTRSRSRTLSMNPWGRRGRGRRRKRRRRRKGRRVRRRRVRRRRVRRGRGRRGRGRGHLGAYGSERQGVLHPS